MNRLEETERSKISQHAYQRLEENALEWGQELKEALWTQVRLRRSS